MDALSNAVGGIRDIGVADQAPATLRRLRAINVVAALACAITFGYCAFYLLFDAALFRREIGFLAVIGIGYVGVLLVTRAHRVETAMWLLFLLALLHLGAINWMLGPRAGALGYLLAMPFIASLLIREGDNVTIWPMGIVACLIFFVVSFSDQPRPFDALSAPAQRVFFLVNVVGAVLLACGVSLFYRWLFTRAEAQLQAEKARGDRLLRAILPAAIAEKLKDDESQTVADAFASTTVIFADIVGFTARAAEVSAARIVTDLNRLFSRADELAALHGVEKIKTIGDAYLAVGGVPDPLPDHPVRVAEFALDLQRAAAELAQTAWPGLELRIAIHSGPVVAGVIGRTKFAYDIWGDTINTAARLEKACAPGEILVTEAVRACLPPRFEVVDRGKVEIRDKGTMAVHRLVGARPANG